MTILTGDFFPGYKYVKDTNQIIGKYGKVLKPYRSKMTHKRYYKLKNKYGKYLNWNERRLLRIWLNYDPYKRLKKPTNDLEAINIAEELGLI